MLAALPDIVPDHLQANPLSLDIRAAACIIADATAPHINYLQLDK